jgi:hypothetical protein
LNHSSFVVSAGTEITAGGKSTRRVSRYACSTAVRALHG